MPNYNREPKLLKIIDIVNRSFDSFIARLYNKFTDNPNNTKASVHENAVSELHKTILEQGHEVVRYSIVDNLDTQVHFEVDLLLAFSCDDMRSLRVPYFSIEIPRDEMLGCWTSNYLLKSFDVLDYKWTNNRCIIYCAADDFMVNTVEELSNQVNALTLQTQHLLESSDLSRVVIRVHVTPQGSDSPLLDSFPLR